MPAQSPLANGRRRMIRNSNSQAINLNIQTTATNRLVEFSRIVNSAGPPFESEDRVYLEIFRSRSISIKSRRLFKTTMPGFPRYRYEVKHCLSRTAVRSGRAGQTFFSLSFGFSFHHGSLRIDGVYVYWSVLHVALILSGHFCFQMALFSFPRHLTIFVSIL